MKRLGPGTLTGVVAAVLLFVVAPLAHGATRFVSDTGADGGDCGIVLTSACRSITRAIALAVPGDTILVGPGRYGDLNKNGALGDIPGEETGSPGCGCVLSINKNVIVISSAGAAATIIDGRSVDVIQNVLLITIGGEFGRPGKGFTVTETAQVGGTGDFDGEGIVLDAANVLVRGNQVIFSRPRHEFSHGTGILTVNDEPIRIEGNLVMGWQVGISGRGAATVSKNQVIANETGIFVTGGTVVGNVVMANQSGISVRGAPSVTTNAVYMNFRDGVVVQAPFSGVVTKNNLFANGDPSEFSECGLENHQAGLSATSNYWGVATGPGAPPADTVCFQGATTSPFATKPFTVKPLKP
jgi:hypothetical protein